MELNQKGGLAVNRRPVRRSGRTDVRVVDEPWGNPRATTMSPKEREEQRLFEREKALKVATFALCG